MLEIKKLSAGYGELQVLKGVSLSVKPKEIVALIGPNGAGKSTILKSVFGVTDITSGAIVYNEKDVTQLHTHDLIELGISYVPQGRINFSTLTVKENLELGGSMIKEQHLLKKATEDVYRKFPVLAEKKDKYAFSLSGGQQQLLALGRSMVQSPQLLLLDEPSLGLSPKATTEIFRDIRMIADRGVGILLVEQNAKKAVELADRTYVLEDGEVALTGGREIIKHKEMKSIYLGGR